MYLVPGKTALLENTFIRDKGTHLNPQTVVCLFCQDLWLMLIYNLGAGEDCWPASLAHLTSSRPRRDSVLKHDGQFQRSNI